MLISRLGSVAKSGRKLNQVTHAAQVEGLTFAASAAPTVDLSHAANVVGLVFGSSVEFINERTTEIGNQRTTEAGNTRTTEAR